MGSSSSKKTLVKISNPTPVPSLNKNQNLDYQSNPQSSTKPRGAPVQSATSVPSAPLPSAYLLPSTPIQSTPYLLDQSSGVAIILDLTSSSTISIDLPIPASSRVFLSSASSILKISNTSCSQIFFPSLKRVNLPSMRTGRVHFSLTTFEGKILLTGGEVNNQAISSCEMFDGERWVDVCSLNESRSWHSSIEHQGAVFVFGGLKRDSIEKLQGKWKLLQCRLNACINRVGLAPISGRILVVGGEVIGVGFNLAGWEFDVDSERLLQIRNTGFHGLFYSAGCFFNQFAYLMGSGVIVEYDPHYKKIQLYN